MKPTQIAELFANIKATIVSFFSIAMFVALGVGVFAGIYWMAPALQSTVDEAFGEGDLHNFQIQFPYGLTQQDLEQLRAVEAEVKQLGATAENLTLAINQLSEPGQLEAHARRLGMQTPSPEQLRVVNLPDVIDDTSAQSVENTDTEESRE